MHPKITSSKQYEFNHLSLRIREEQEPVGQRKWSFDTLNFHIIVPSREHMNDQVLARNPLSDGSFLVCVESTRI